MKEARGLYEPEFKGWAAFVSQVLEWLGNLRPVEDHKSLFCPWTVIKDQPVEELRSIAS